MLNFDELAKQKAEDSGQSLPAWMAAIWDPHFQKLTETMSDGEVGELVRLCPNVETFTKLTRFLEARAAAADGSALDLLELEARRFGLSPAEWIKAKL